MEIPDGITSLPIASCGVPAVLTIGSSVKQMSSKAFSFDQLNVLRVKAMVPPTLDDSFSLTMDQNDALTLIVNNGRKTSYITNARWKQIDNIIEESSSDVVIYMTGEYPVSEEIRTTTGIMPSQVTKMKVIGPLTSSDLRLIKENMISLRSLDLSDVTNITEIPADQFKGSLLTEIVLPANLEKIGANAFDGCRLLRISDLPESIKEIGAGAFRDCIGLTITHLPEALETIYQSAFEGCTGITELTAGSSLTTISESAFSECKLLETVDLSASQVSSIAGSTFYGCRELDEIILPSTVNNIGRNAFKGTAIRDISFAEGVKDIAGGAFSDCRRLVGANLPQEITTVSADIFGNCPRLIAVSMPAGTETVDNNVVNGDKRLANISCAAVNAPAASTGAFDNIRIRYVSLVVPASSYRSYLNAPQWGKFQSIQNSIPVTIDPGVDVTNVDEDEYQDMVEEDAREEAEEAAALEVVVDNPEENEDPELNEEEVTAPARKMAKRAQRRAAARANTSLSFAALFDGAQIQTGTEGHGTRIFLHPHEGVEILSILFNGKEMIDEVEDNSLLLPVGSKGSLVIKTDSSNVGVDAVGEELNGFESETSRDIYNMQGMCIKRNATDADIDALTPGLYIIGGKKVVVK